MSTAKYRFPPIPSRDLAEKKRTRWLTVNPIPFPPTDVVSIDKTDEHFRLIYDSKGRFVVHRISSTEAQVSVPSSHGFHAGFYPKTASTAVFYSPPALHSLLTLFIPISLFKQQYKLCKVKAKRLGDKGVPCVNLHDGRTIRYPDPVINESDTVMVDIATNKITDRIKYDAGSLVMITGGRNRGRVGVIQRREKHKGAIEIVHVKDAGGHEFATRSSNTFVIGEGNKPMISLPKGKGLRLTIVEELERRKEA